MNAIQMLWIALAERLQPGEVMELQTQYRKDNAADSAASRRRQRERQKQNQERREKRNKVIP